MKITAHIHFKPIHQILFKTQQHQLLLAGFLEQIGRLEFIDAIHILSEIDLNRPVEDLLKRWPIGQIEPQTHPYKFGFPEPDQFRQMMAAQPTQSEKQIGDIFLYLDPAFLLFSADNLENMFDLLMEDEQMHVIYPVYKVDPHIYLKKKSSEDFFPVWEYAGLDRQKYPQLFRKIGLYLFHAGRPRYKQPVKEGYYPIPWTQGKCCLTDQWLDFAAHLNR